MKKRKIVNAPRPKIKVMNAEPKEMKLGDFESVKKGAVDIVDGLVLLSSGLFRLIAFSIMTAIDGLKSLFAEKKKDDETEYTTIAEMRLSKKKK